MLFIPTEREQGVFGWLWMLRMLTLDQIRRLQYYRPDMEGYTSRVNLRKRLRGLEAGGFLRGLSFRSKDCREKFYFLDTGALPYLDGRFGIEQRRLYTHSLTQNSPHLFHPMMVAECAVCVVESLRGTSVTLPGLAPFGAPFYGTHAVENPRAKLHTHRFLTQEDLQGHGRRLRIRPDLIFALQWNDEVRLYFLEADRGLERVQTLKEKLEAYQEFRRLYASVWKKYHPGIKQSAVLLVTTTAARVRSILRSMPDPALLAAVRLTTLEDLKRSNAVFDPIWSRADQPEASELMVPDEMEHPIKTGKIHAEEEDLP